MSYITFDNNHLYKKIINIMKQTLQKQLSLRLLMILALFIGVGSNALADTQMCCHFCLTHVFFDKAFFKSIFVVLFIVW